MDDEGAAGVAAAEYGQTDIFSFPEVRAVLREYERCAGASGIAEFSDVVQETPVGQFELMRYICHDPQIGLMADYVVKLVCLYASCNFSCLVKRMDHIFAGVDEYIAAVRHSDAVLFRTELDSFRTFGDVAEAARIYGFYFRFISRGRFR